MKVAFKTFLVSLINLLRQIGISIQNKFHVKNLLKIKYVFALGFSYLLVITSIIFIYIDIPYNYKSNTITMALYSTQQRIGESLTYDRINAAAKRNGWNVIGVCLPEDLALNFATRHFFLAAINLVNWIYKPTFNFHSTHHSNTTPHGYNIMSINVPNENIIGAKGDFKKQFRHLANYDAYVDIYSLVHGSNPMLLHALSLHNNETAPIFPLFFAVNHMPYSSAKREQINIVGSLWGCNRESLRVFSVIKRLAKENLLVAYGLKPFFEPLGCAYKGRIEEQIDTNTEKVDGLFNIQKKYGISLVLHNLEHLIDGIPTNRIVESISAGSIVISDNHPFVKKYFGDTVLYFDAFAQPDEMYDQIQKHVMWIRNHPDEAEKKAKAAHKILEEQLTMEKALLKLSDLVDKNKDYKKEV